MGEWGGYLGGYLGWVFGVVIWGGYLGRVFGPVYGVGILEVRISCKTRGLKKIVQYTSWNVISGPIIPTASI